MKYVAIIDTDEKPVSCDFIGCNGNVAPHKIGTTTDIKALGQDLLIESILNEITEEVRAIERYATNNFHDIWLRTPEEIKADVFQILNKYKTKYRRFE